MDIVNETQNPAALLMSGQAFGEFLAGMTQQFLQGSQTAVQNLIDLNTEFVSFIDRRANKNRETFSRMTQCQTLPEFFNTQAEWTRQAFDDYSRQAGRLTECNARLVGSMVPASRQDGASSFATRVPGKAKHAAPASALQPA